MAVQSLAVEGFILLSVSLLVIGLRFYVRIEAVGWKGLAAHDYLMIVIAFAYSALIATLYFSMVQCHGLANSYMTEEERISLDPESDEYLARVLGSKLDLVDRILYIVVLWLTKVAMLAFYLCLTNRLGSYQKRIWFGFALLGVTWLAELLITLLACTPISRNWQIYPDPGGVCYPSTSLHSLICSLCLNIGTSLYVFVVPLPVLWMANIKLWKKIGLILLISANGFVIIISILRGYRIIVSAKEHTMEGGKWEHRVCFVAIVTANLPLLFPLIRKFVIPLLKPRPKAQPQMTAGWDSTSTSTSMKPKEQEPDRDVWWIPSCCEDSCLLDSDTDDDDDEVNIRVDIESTDPRMNDELRSYRREMMEYERKGQKSPG